jgi:hypothetical protein
MGSKTDRAWRAEYLALGVDRPVRELERWRLEGGLLPPDDATPEERAAHLRYLDRIAPGRGGSFRWTALLLAGHGFYCEGLRAALLDAYGLTGSETISGGPELVHGDIEFLANQVIRGHQELDSKDFSAVALRRLFANLRRQGKDPENGEGCCHELIEDLLSYQLKGTPGPWSAWDDLLPTAFDWPVAVLSGDGGILDEIATQIERSEFTKPEVSSRYGDIAKKPFIDKVGELIREAPLLSLVEPIPLARVVVDRLTLPNYGIEASDDESAVLAAVTAPGLLALPGFRLIVDLLGGISNLAALIELSPPSAISRDAQLTQASSIIPSIPTGRRSSLPSQSLDVSPAHRSGPFSPNDPVIPL